MRDKKDHIVLVDFNEVYRIELIIETNVHG